MKVTPDDAKYWQQHCSSLDRAKKHSCSKANVIEQTNFICGDNIPLQQRLWHIVEEIYHVPSCKRCDNQVSWDVRFKQYKKYCGNPSCYGSDPDVIAKKQQKMDTTEIKQKRQQTCLDRYGHTNFLASDVGKQQVAKSFESQTPDEKQDRYNKVKNTRKQTMIEKYGVPNISSAQLTRDAREKLEDKDWLTEQHCNNRKSLSEIGSMLNIISGYAVVNRFMQMHNIHVDNDVRLSIDTKHKLNSKNWLIQSHHIDKKSLTMIACELGVNGGATIIGKYCTKHGIEILNPTPRSVGEQQIVEFLQPFTPNIVLNSKSIISPYELDVFLPDYNLAIEYCGLYWHSEQQGKGRQYHKKKYELCLEQGIQLLTIYEDEWMQRQQQVKNKLMSLINQDVRPKIYARKTHIVNVTTATKRKFFDDNHIQGNGPGSINVGLMHNTELVACMSFIKHNTHHYLNRYATSSRVVGGFSKLLKYFQQTFNWTEIISFADLRWSDGNLYQATGWKLDSILEPDYYYSPDGHNRFHKFNYRRKNLPTLLSSFDPELSERVNCDNNGILRIWDCGKIRFSIKNGG